MIVDFVQVKMAKGRHTLTMNLISHIMTYETKKKMSSLIIKKVWYISLKKKTNKTQEQKRYKNNKTPDRKSVVRERVC